MFDYQRVNPIQIPWHHNFPLVWLPEGTFWANLIALPPDLERGPTKHGLLDDQPVWVPRMSLFGFRFGNHRGNHSWTRVWGLIPKNGIISRTGGLLNKQMSTNIGTSDSLGSRLAIPIQPWFWGLVFFAPNVQCPLNILFPWLLANCKGQAGGILHRWKW